MSTSPNRSIIAALLGACTLAGCGGTTQAVRPSSEFTTEHGEFFEDGFDFVREPAQLEGRWLESWEREIAKRVELSDLIALVTVVTLRTDEKLERAISFRVTARIDRALKGSLPEDEVTLMVGEAQAGYASVQDNQRRITNHKFVAYLKWYEDKRGRVAAHWHLSPASEGIVAKTEHLIEEQSEGKKVRRKVFVHRDKY
jgi:hypothetical protein